MSANCKQSVEDVPPLELRMRNVLKDYPETRGEDHLSRASLEDSGVEASDEELAKRLFENLTKVKDRYMSKADAHLVRLLDEFSESVEKRCVCDGGCHTLTADPGRGGVKARHSDGYKVFLSRRSMLTDLLENKHILTIHNIFVSLLIVFTISQMADDVFEHGDPLLHFDFMFSQFSSVPFVITIWFVMFCFSSVGVYWSFHYWAHSRPAVAAVLQQDWLSLAALGFFLTIFLFFPAFWTVTLSLPGAATAIVMCEQLRFMMKIHSFIRENVPRTMGIPCQLPLMDLQDKAIKCPDFTKYLYFLFVPSLIYRDTYPRTPYIRWNFVCSSLLQVIAGVTYTNFIFARFCMPVFKTFAVEPLSVKLLIRCSLSCMIPGTAVLIFLFYTVLHCWMNAFAEIMCFADRRFYLDWWNSTSFSAFYRTWNIVVHDWLYNYIYLDALVLFNGKRNLSYMCVFAFSSLLHEYLLYMVLKIFYPILLFVFGVIGFIYMLYLKPKPSRRANIVFWCNMVMGAGVLLCLYGSEVWARNKCRVHGYDSYVLYYLLPRSWACAIFDS